MPGVMEQVKELVRTATNHARRIRRLETLQVPIALARPTGGHIIQDEGIALTDRVYLNFVGVRVEAVDDPDNGATIITVSDPEGDDFCRVVPLDVGWQINAGIDSRYMKHSTAFQLSGEGNARGVCAIDLQQETNALTQVAAGDYSAILSGRRNIIGTDCNYTGIVGAYNEVTNLSWNVFILGAYNLVYDDSYSININGHAMDVEKGQYCFLSGEGHIIAKGANDSAGALGVSCLGEDNTFSENANDYPTYCGIIGINNIMDGDVFVSHQFGESNKLYSLGGGGVTTAVWNLQSGHDHYAQHVMTNTQLGRSTKSSLPSATSDFYHGRVLNQGDEPNDFPTDGTGWPGGFNQDSWFAQSDLITTWNVAWTTSRFQFPIIPDSVWYFESMIAATERGCVNSHAWKIEGFVENDGGTTTILSSIVTNFYRDVATKEWQVVADDPNDRLVFQFRDTGGPDATWTNVQIRVHTVEVGAEV